MNGKVIMIASGKGGTGKSTAAVYIGAQLAAMGRQVLLVELDAGLRSVDIISGVYGRTVYDVEDILSGRCIPEKAVVESPLYPGLQVVSAPYSGGEVSAAPLVKLVEALSKHLDYILLDTAAGMGAPFTAAAAVSQLALLVLTPDPVALRDGRIVADWLYTHSKAVPRLVINRVDPARQYKSAVPDLDECIDTVAAQLIAVIPESTELQQAASTSTPLPRSSTAWQAFHNLARRLEGESVPLLLR